MSDLDRLAEALAAFDRGWWLTPLRKKIPILKGWSELPRCTREEVIEWATNGNVGVRMGVVRRPDGLVLGGLDVDPGAPPEFVDAWERFETPWARTPRGGTHGYFWVPPGLRNSTSQLAEHVDIRGRGGQLVLAGADGYSWIKNPETIAVFPQEWLDRLGAHGKLSRAASKIKQAPEGTRNDTLNREAWRLRPEIAAGALNENEVREQLAAASPLPSAETQRTLQSALTVRVTGNERIILAPGVHGNGLVSTSLEFTTRVLSAIPADALYLRANILGEVVGNRWEPIGPHRLRGIVDEHVQVKQLKDKGERGLVEVVGHVTDEHAKLIIANASASGVPRSLRALCTHPVITRDMSVLGPGWHSEHGLLIQGCEVANTAMNPLDLAVNFPLDAFARANLLALLATIMQRPALGGGNVPIFVATAPQPRVGKSFLMHALVGAPMFAGPIPSDTWPDDPEEVRKLLLACLLGGGELYMIDNVPKRLDSPPLASFATAPKQGGRVLGATRWVEVDNNLTIIANGNQVEASEEIARRSVVIPFLPLDEEPDQRRGFVYADLMDACLEARARILRWMIDLAEGAARTSSIILGGFERWALGTGRLLHAYPVLQNRARHVATMSRAEDNLADLAPLMIEILRDAPFSAVEALQFANQTGWGGERLDPMRSERSRAIAMGRVLKANAGRIFGRVRLTSRFLHGQVVYQWVGVDTGG